MAFSLYKNSSPSELFKQLQTAAQDDPEETGMLLKYFPACLRTQAEQNAESFSFRPGQLLNAYLDRQAPCVAFILHMPHLVNESDYWNLPKELVKVVHETKPELRAELVCRWVHAEFVESEREYKGVEVSARISYVINTKTNEILPYGSEKEDDNDFVIIPSDRFMLYPEDVEKKRISQKDFQLMHIHAIAGRMLAICCGGNFALNQIAQEKFRVIPMISFLSDLKFDLAIGKGLETGNRYLVATDLEWRLA